MRDGIYAALREAGVSPERVAQMERLISTAVLGFAVSEAGGRFRNHTRAQLDADFEMLEALLVQFIDSAGRKPGEVMHTLQVPL